LKKLGTLFLAISLVLVTSLTAIPAFADESLESEPVAVTEPAEAAGGATESEEEEAPAEAEPVSEAAISEGGNEKILAVALAASEGGIQALAGEEVTEEEGVTTAAELLAQIQAAPAGSETVIRVSGSFGLDTAITIPAGKIIRIQSSNGATISMNSTTANVGHFSVSGSLTIDGVNLTGNILAVSTGASTGDTANGGVRVNSGGVFTLEAGTISYCRVTKGGVYVAKGGLFVMNGGTITGCPYSGVYLYEGTLNMNGGSISNNVGYLGGGLCLDGDYGSKANIYGGSISGNRAKYGGGGIGISSLYGGCVVNMYGGAISGNTASNDMYNALKYGYLGCGGAVYLYPNETFNLFGGTISGNTAFLDGGGVFVSVQNPYDQKGFRATGGEISGNTAGRNGGGVAISGYGAPSSYSSIYNKYLLNSAYIQVSASVVFSGNSAANGFYTPPSRVSNIATTTSSVEGQYAVNNYDIAYTSTAKATLLTVQFFLDGELVKTQTNVPSGTKVTSPEGITVAEGYTFDGWYSSAAKVSVWNFSANTVSASANKFYAFSNPIYFEVTFVDEDGETQIGETVSVRYGQDAVAPEDPAGKDEGHRVFAGWDTPFTEVKANLTVAAIYEFDVHSVTFEAGEHGAFEEDAQTTFGGITHGTLWSEAGISVLDVTPEEGWTFAGWSVDIPEDGEAITGDLVFTALYEEVVVEEEPEVIPEIEEETLTPDEPEAASVIPLQAVAAAVPAVQAAAEVLGVPAVELAAEAVPVAAEEIAEEASPRATTENDWPLLNLVFAAMGVLMAAFALIAVLRKKARESERKMPRVLAIGSLLVAGLGIAFLLLTEDFLGKMVLADAHTVVQACILVLTALPACLAAAHTREEEEKN
jgi:uncharacterized repeat protein (TIGR02543 family)